MPLPIPSGLYSGEGAPLPTGTAQTTIGTTGGPAVLVSPVVVSYSPDATYGMTTDAQEVVKVSGIRETFELNLDASGAADFLNSFDVSGLVFDNTLKEINEDPSGCDVVFKDSIKVTIANMIAGAQNVASTPLNLKAWLNQQLRAAFIAAFPTYLDANEQTEPSLSAEAGAAASDIADAWQAYLDASGNVATAGANIVADASGELASATIDLTDTSGAYAAELADPSGNAEWRAYASVKVVSDALKLAMEAAEAKKLAAATPQITAAGALASAEAAKLAAQAAVAAAEAAVADPTTPDSEAAAAALAAAQTRLSTAVADVSSATMTVTAANLAFDASNGVYLSEKAAYDKAYEFTVNAKAAFDLRQANLLAAKNTAAERKAAAVTSAAGAAARVTAAVNEAITLKNTLYNNYNALLASANTEVAKALANIGSTYTGVIPAVTPVPGDVVPGTKAYDYIDGPNDATSIVYDTIINAFSVDVDVSGNAAASNFKTQQAAAPVALRRSLYRQAPKSSWSVYYDASSNALSTRGLPLVQGDSIVFVFDVDLKATPGKSAPMANTPNVISLDLGVRRVAFKLNIMPTGTQGAAVPGMAPPA